MRHSVCSQVSFTRSLINPISLFWFRPFAAHRLLLVQWLNFILCLFHREGPLDWRRSRSPCWGGWHSFVCQRALDCFISLTLSRIVLLASLSMHPLLFFLGSNRLSLFLLFLELQTLLMRGKPIKKALIFPRTPFKVDILSSVSVAGWPPPSRLHHTLDQKVIVSRSNGKLEQKTTGLWLLLNSI